MPQAVRRYGEVLLTTPAQPVDPHGAGLDALLTEMIDAMHAAPGIGLAAPQLGVPVRVFVIDLSAGTDPAAVITMLNPVVDARSGLQLEEEGCLSVPGLTATVPRPLRLRVRGLDRDRREQVIEGTGLLARALQHEIDHLNGVLFLDRVRPIQRKALLRQVARRERSGRW